MTWVLLGEFSVVGEYAGSFGYGAELVGSWSLVTLQLRVAGKREGPK